MNLLLLEKLKYKYSTDEIDKILSGLACDRKTTFRVNNLKSNRIEIENVLKNLNIEFESIKEYPDAFILSNCNFCNNKHIEIKTNTIIEDLDIYKNGLIYLQSLSSMKPLYVLEPKSGENILDMCAAPGSKTTMIQSITNNKVNLTAVELHKDRFEKLKYNCDLQGINVLLLNRNALDLDDYLKFDKILLDAPCSGSGILALNYDNCDYFTEKLINKCVATQKRLIKKASNILRKDGLLIYSTCSLLKEENEEIVEFALKNGFKHEKIGDENFIKIMPDEYFEGFFISKLRKY